MQYASEVEANKALEVANKRRSLGFCPLLKSACVDSCVCWSDARLEQSPHSGGFWVYDPFCSNVLISGTIYIEQ